jgi:hypothetical protein
MASRSRRTGEPMRVAIGLVLLLGACTRDPERPPTAEPNATRVTIESDSDVARSWIRRAAERWSALRATTPLSSQSVARVRDDSMERATKMLAATPWKQLSEKEADELAATPLATLGNGVPVLLRCVEVVHGDPQKDSEQQKDGFLVYWLDGTVDVVSSGWRFDSYPFRTAAVVAVLPTVPTDVFVEQRYTIHNRPSQYPNGAR